jgi:zinc protease
MKKLIIITGLLLPTILFGQLDRSIRPTQAKAPKINIKDSEVFTTANGITVILSENHKLPRVSFALSMGSDPRTEGSKAGMSDMSGSLILSGTTNRTKDQFDNEKDYIGASIDAGKSSISLSCLTKHVDKGLTLMSDVLLNANFPQSEFDRIKKQNESGLQSAKSAPGTMAQNAESKVNFPNHPYGEVMTETTLANITREDVVNYYKSTFTPKGSYLVIVGDITKAQATKLIEQYFSKYQERFNLLCKFHSL